jgi:phosphoglycerate dehydrogenase-like enzyme
MKVLIPDTITLELKANTTDTFVQYNVESPFSPAHADAEVLVVWGNPAANLQSAVATLPNLKFIQTLAAGPDAVVQAGFNFQAD